MISRRQGRRLLRRLFRQPVSAGVVLLVLLLMLLLQWHQRKADVFSFESAGPYRVQRVVDGDTLLLEDGTRVRLIGVDTPETKHPQKPVERLGQEATLFTRQHIEGRWVTLRFDRERRDKYRRVLAYVFRDEWFLNEELIRAGYSRAETRFPYSAQMKRRFRQAEAEARQQRRGIWAFR